MAGAKRIEDALFSKLHAETRGAPPVSSPAANPQTKYSGVTHLVKTYQKILAVTLLLLIGSLVIALNQTVRENSMDVPGFVPIKDDALASRYAPRLLLNDRYGNPQEMLYRASKDDAGNIHITYHPIWAKEENTGSGWKPFLSRWLYTGGLRLQRVMFGVKDIEGVSLVITPKGEVVRALYETADQYSDSDFGVKHKPVVIDGKVNSRLVFEVMSWNHLFRLVEQDEASLKGKLVALEPHYFTQALWLEYTMVKAEEKTLSKNRAHQVYEREFVE